MLLPHLIFYFKPYQITCVIQALLTPFQLPFMPNVPVDVYNHLDYFTALFHEARENSILLLDKNGMILEVNKAFTSSFGYEQHEVCGKFFGMLFTEEDQHKQRPQKEIAAVLSQGQAFDNNYLVQQDGIATWVSGESTLIRDEEGINYILKIIQNINGQKISESAIISLNNFNDSILTSIEDGIAVITNDLDILKANTAFSAMFALDAGKINGISFSTLVAPYDKNQELLHKISVAIESKKGFNHAQLRINENTDKEKTFEVSCTLVKDGVTPTNLLLVVHDITVQKKAERDRDDLIGFIGHELRNPMTNVLLSHNLLEALVETGKTSTIKELLERSRQNVLRLNSMITQLYNSTKINAGHFELEKTTFGLAAMLAEAVDTVKVLNPDFAVAISNPVADLMVTADRYRLIQVVTNYLSNAIKYAGGNKNICVMATVKNDFIEVAVKDNGMGIAEAHLPFIFDRFFRAEKTTNLEGIGLGLFLCKQIIHAHNGQVWVESEEGKGSTFYFSVPLVG